MSSISSNDRNLSQQAIDHFETQKVAGEIGSGKRYFLVKDGNRLRCVESQNIKINVFESFKSLFKSRAAPQDEVDQVRVGLFDIMKSWFGKGPLSMRQIAHFCSEQKLGGMVLTQQVILYNKSHWLWKKVSKQDELVLQADMIKRLLDSPKIKELRPDLTKDQIDLMHSVLQSISDKKPISEEIKKKAFPSLLSQAIGVHCNDLAKAIMAQGADINARLDSNETPLHIAAAAGNTEMIRMLVAKGANVHAKDDHGYNPLLAGCNYGQEESIKALLSRDARAQLEEKDNDGRTAVQVAKKSYHYHLEDLLKELAAKAK